MAPLGRVFVHGAALAWAAIVSNLMPGARLSARAWAFVLKAVALWRPSGVPSWRAFVHGAAPCGVASRALRDLVRCRMVGVPRVARRLPPALCAPLGALWLRLMPGTSPEFSPRILQVGGLHGATTPAGLGRAPTRAPAFHSDTRARERALRLLGAAPKGVARLHHAACRPAGGSGCRVGPVRLPHSSHLTFSQRCSPST